MCIFTVKHLLIWIHRALQLPLQVRLDVAAARARSKTTLQAGCSGCAANVWQGIAGWFLILARECSLGKPWTWAIVPWNNHWLVVWNMNLICPYIGNVIIPIDFHTFQRSWNHQPDWVYHWLTMGLPGFPDSIQAGPKWIQMIFVGLHGWARHAIAIFRWACPFPSSSEVAHHFPMTMPQIWAMRLSHGVFNVSFQVLDTLVVYIYI